MKWDTQCSIFNAHGPRSKFETLCLFKQLKFIPRQAPQYTQYVVIMSLLLTRNHTDKNKASKCHVCTPQRLLKPTIQNAVPNLWLLQALFV